jgi:dynein assembly factor 3
VISSYYSVHPFDMERMWDDRMRHFFADRYDHRRNVVDWDYSFDVKNLVPQMFIMEYKQWRVTGLAFETRLATNTVPNRTMGSYVPGNHVSALNCTHSLQRKKRRTRSWCAVSGGTSR